MSVTSRTPSTKGLALTGLFALIGGVAATIAGGFIALLAIPVALVGVYRVSRTVLAIGVTGLFAGVLMAGMAGGGTEFVLIGMIGAIVTWDVGENAISLAEQLRVSAADRLEVIHGATSALVASSVGVAAFVGFEAINGGFPTVVLSLLVFGTVLVLVVLSR